MFVDRRHTLELGEAVAEDVVGGLDDVFLAQVVGGRRGREGQKLNWGGHWVSGWGGPH